MLASDGRRYPRLPHTNLGIGGPSISRSTMGGSEITGRGSGNNVDIKCTGGSISSLAMLRKYRENSILLIRSHDYSNHGEENGQRFFGGIKAFFGMFVDRDDPILRKLREAGTNNTKQLDLVTDKDIAPHLSYPGKDSLNADSLNAVDRKSIYESALLDGRVFGDNFGGSVKVNLSDFVRAVTAIDRSGEDVVEFVEPSSVKTCQWERYPSREQIMDFFNPAPRVDISVGVMEGAQRLAATRPVLFWSMLLVITLLIIMLYHAYVDYQEKKTQKKKHADSMISMNDIRLRTIMDEPGFFPESVTDHRQLV